MTVDGAGAQRLPDVETGEAMLAELSIWVIWPGD
jgi:hypothetical protein